MNYLNITYQTFLMDLDTDASVAPTYRKEKLKNRMVKHYGTKIVFQPQLNPSLPELVFSSGVELQDVMNTASKLRQDDVEDEFQITFSNETERILYLAGKILQKELLATVGIQYSPVNIDDISQDNAEAIVPNKFFSFPHLLMTPNKKSDEISIDKEFSRTGNESFHRLVLSVEQDIVYIYISEFPRKNLLPVFFKIHSLFFMQLCSLLIFRKVNICFAKFYKGLW